MSSIAGVCRISARLAARRACRRAPSRGLSRSSIPCAAQNFNLPSLSPTMTEGGITKWNVKEGDSYSAGDVLLEIETDKAQMDVEAQDDGKVFKILQQDGAKGLKVGTRIAVLAEPDDDLKSMEIPQEENTSQPEHKAKASVSEETPKAKEEKRKDTKPSTGTSSSSQEQPKSPSSTNDKPKSQKYPLYPSVQHLLHINGISPDDVSKMSASGPNGRLLKGDVLSYLGKIEKAYASDQAKRITKLGHLDLSNIKKAAPKKATPSPQTKTAEAIAEPELDTQIAVPVSLTAVFATQKRLQDALGITLPLSTFIARASEMANENLPRVKSAPTADELFDAILGLDKVQARQKGSRGTYVPQITALAPGSTPTSSHRTGSVAPKKPVDILDALIGRAKTVPKRQGSTAATLNVSGATGAKNVFSVAAKKGEEKRVRVYLERVKTVLESEPGSCVL